MHLRRYHSCLLWMLNWAFMMDFYSPSNNLEINRRASWHTPTAEVVAEQIRPVQIVGFGPSIPGIMIRGIVTVETAATAVAPVVQVIPAETEEGAVVAAEAVAINRL